MLRKAEDIYGCTIRALDGEAGSVHDLYVDKNWQVEYVLIDAGRWLANRLVLIATQALGPPAWRAEVLPVMLTRRQIENSPEMILPEPLLAHAVLDTPPADLQSSRDLLGFRVQSVSRGRTIGFVEDFLLNAEDWRVQYILLDTRSWATDRRPLIAPKDIKAIDQAETIIQVDEEALHSYPTDSLDT